MTKVTLTYSATTNHVKLDKAVIGRVEQGMNSWSYIPFKFNAQVIEAATLTGLLGKVKESLKGLDA